MRQLLRWFRGALGTALMWAVVWFVGGLLVGFFLLADGASDITSLESWAGASDFAKVVGLVGFLTGGTFSVYVAMAFRNQRLDDLSPRRFAIGGAIVAVCLDLGLMASLAFYDMIDSGVWHWYLGWNDVLYPALFSATFGSLTGFSSIKIAQAALPGAGDAQERLTP